MKTLPTHPYYQAFALEWISPTRFIVRHKESGLAVEACRNPDDGNWRVSVNIAKLQAETEGGLIDEAVMLLRMGVHGAEQFQIAAEQMPMTLEAMGIFVCERMEKADFPPSVLRRMKTKLKNFDAHRARWIIRKAKKEGGDE